MYKSEKNDYVTYNQCLDFCDFLGYEVTERTLKDIVRKNIKDKIKVGKNTLLNKNEFSSFILANRLNKKRKVKKKNNKDLSSNDIYYNLNIGIDWFQCTFYALRKTYFEKSDVMKLFCDLLGIEQHQVYSSDKKVFHYKYSLEYDCIRLLYGDEHYNHCSLQLTGQGCKVLDELLWEQDRTYFDFFKMVLDYKGKVTRIDVAIDDHSPLFELEELEDKIRNHSDLIKTKFQTFKFVHEIKNNITKGLTIYCGSNKSTLFCRFYKKGIEIEEKQGTKQHDFNRFEIVMRDEKANSFFKQIAKSGMLKEKSISVLNNYFSVFETDEMINYWDKWESLIQGSMQFRFETVKKRKTVEKKFAYLCSTASNTLAVVIKAKEKAKELGLESSEYDTVQEILSYKTISKEEEENLVNDYIEKKKSIKENMY